MQNTSLVRTIYFYLVAVITLVMLIVAVTGLINLGLRTWVFTEADSNHYGTPRTVAELEKEGVPTEEAEMIVAEES